MPDSLVPVRDRVSFSKLDEALPLPDLVGIQRESFDWLLAEGLKEVLEEVSPIEDFTEQFQLHFGKHAFKEQKFTEEECKDKDATFSAPLFVEAMFVNKTTGEIKEQEVFMGDFPMMTERGHLHHQRHRAGGRVPARALPRGLLQPRAGQDHRQGRLHRQDHPQPRGVARVRRRQEGHRRCPDRPQAPAERHGAAQGARVVGGRDPRALRPRRVDQEHPREGPRRDPRGGPGGHLPQAAARRATDGRVRPDAPGEPLLQPQALRPGSGGSVQGQQEARGRPGRAPDAAEGPCQAAGRARQPRQEGVGPAEVPRLVGAPEGRAGRERAEVQGDPVLRGHAPHGPLPREAARGRGGLRARRHRPLREPAPALGRRADPEPDPDRPLAHGAGRPRADDDAGRRGDHAPDPDQHPSGGGEHQGVLRHLASCRSSWTRPTRSPG